MADHLRWVKLIMMISAVAVAAVGLVALVSYRTTHVTWDGGFPAGEFRLYVRDPDGKPVKGAILCVYHDRTRDPAFEYPLDNHVAGQDLVSDENGRIIAVRRNGGLQFGGDAWQLFWVIPMGAKAPQYDCEITATGFKQFKFSVWRLFESPYRYFEDFPKTKLKVGSKEVKVPIYEHTFTLER